MKQLVLSIVIGFPFFCLAAERPEMSYDNRTLGEWIKILREKGDRPQEKGRIEALTAIAEMHRQLHEKTCSALLEVAREDDESVAKGFAVVHLAEYTQYADRVLPALIDVMRKSIHRARASESISKFGKAALPYLVPILKDKDVLVRGSAIALIEDLGRDAASAKEEIMGLINDENEYIRRSARSALKHIEKKDDAEITLRGKSLSALTKSIKEGTNDEKLLAISIIEEASDSFRQTTVLLLELLDSENVNLARTAAHAIGNLPFDAASVARLSAKLDADPHHDIATAIADSLNKFGGDGKRALIKAMANQSLGVRAIACNAYSPDAGTADAAVPVVAKLLRERSVGTKVVAASTLGSIGKPAHAALDELSLLLNDDDVAVKRAAQSAIEKIKASSKN